MAEQFIESLKETLQHFKDKHQGLGEAIDDMEAMLVKLLGGEAPKRRGRRPGAAAAVAPKKRGRPPGKKTGGKRRGRPPGSKNVSTVFKKAAGGKSKAKKKAGRPKWTPEQRKAAAERLAKARAAKAAARSAKE